jgi:hypothetical protein
MTLAAAKTVFARPKIVFPAQERLRSAQNTGICRKNAVLPRFLPPTAATGALRGGEGGTAAGADRLTVGDQTRHFRGGRAQRAPRPGFRVTRTSQAASSPSHQTQNIVQHPENRPKITTPAVVDSPNFVNQKAGHAPFGCRRPVEAAGGEELEAKS